MDRTSLNFYPRSVASGLLSEMGPVPACRFSSDPFFRFAFLFFGIFFVSLIAEGPASGVGSHRACSRKHEPWFAFGKV
jgi:hypothetical protein